MRTAKKYFIRIFIAVFVIVNCLVLNPQTLLAEPDSSTSAISNNASQQPLQTGNSQVVNGMDTLVAENDVLALYMNNTLTSIAVLDKRTGKVWYSNPENMAEDKVAQGANKDRLKSQLYITYYDRNGQKKTYDNYYDCIKSGQFDITKIENGVRITYNIGKVAKGKEDIPQRLSDKRFKEIFTENSKLSDSDKATISKRYTYHEGMKLWMWVTTGGDAAVPNVLKILEKAGYTDEDLVKDNREQGIPAYISDKVLYTIPVEYVIEKDNFIAKIPMSEVKYPKSYPVTQLEFMEFFGAAYVTQEGYTVLPDGSGALIKFDANYKTTDQYYASVYGDDKSILTFEKRLQAEQILLPIYGQKQGKNAFMAIIEDGETLANITAYRAGRLNAYNSVYPTFSIVGMDYIRLGDGNKASQIPTFQEQIYQGEIKIRYAFLEGDDANYSGMAEYYRNYLINRYGMEKVKAKDNIPFYVETLGAVKKTKSFLGITYSGMVPLTTFDQAQIIIGELKSRGLSNINLKYTGWFNGGMNQSMPTRIKPESVLGGSSDLKKLIEYTANEGIEFYPNVQFMKVTNYDNGFSKYRDAARNLDDRFSRMFIYNLVTFGKSGEGYVISPNRLPVIVDKFLKSFDKYSFNSVSISDMGAELSSDFHKSKLIARQDSLKIVDEQVSKIKNNVGKIMIDEGNSYAAPYADHILSVPFANSSFNIEDESIPLYQLVYHGYVEYAGEPLNMVEAQRDELLKIIEYGAGLYYRWIYEESSVLKQTSYDYNYSTSYSIWIDDAVNFYNEANELLKNTQGKIMANHEKLADKVYKTTYEDGTSIIVNYNKQNVEVNGMQIGAQNYKLIKEER